MSAKIKNSAKYRRSHNKHKPKNVSHHAFSKVYWPYIPVVLALTTLLTFGGLSGGLQSALKHPTGKVLAYATTMSIGGLLDDTNSARTANGVAGVNLNSQLDAAAQAQADDMATRDYWSHDTPEGSPPWTWVQAQGYSYQALAQNLAAGFDNEQDTINGWLGSPEHRTNMLNPIYSDVGFGFADSSNYTAAGGGPMTIVVAFYGEPAGTAAVAPPAHNAPVATNTTRSAPTAAAPVASTPTPTSSPAGASTPPPAAASQPATASTAKTTVQVANNVSRTNPGTTGKISVSYRASDAELAFAQLPISNFATGLLSFLAAAIAGFWLSRHLLGLRRAFATSEKFVIKHPMLDLCLLGIVVLSYLLTQTAGFIQ